MAFDRETYLLRVGLDGLLLRADVEGLALLQAAQMRAITFENIDPLLGRVPDLEPDVVWHKLIHAGRGGYCFELNGLFAHVLGDLGFSFRPIMARVRMGAPSGGPRSHHAFIVTIDGMDYLADTGFGGPAPAAPLAIRHDEAQIVAGVGFRIRLDDATGEEVLERRAGDGWLSLYGFDRAPVAPPDYAAANFVAARSDRSQFPFNLTMTRMTPSGRLSLRNRVLRMVDGADSEMREVASRDELAELLRGPFALTLPEEDVAAVWEKIAHL